MANEQQPETKVSKTLRLAAYQSERTWSTLERKKKKKESYMKMLSEKRGGGFLKVFVLFCFVFSHSI